jgi:hypothetical protein
MRAVLLMVAMLSVATAGRASPLPDKASEAADSERLALGRQLVLEMTPSQATGAYWAEAAMRWVLAQKFNVVWAKALSGQPPYDVSTGLLANVPEVRKSVTVGVAKIADQLPDALGAAYARDFDADTLRAAVAFYGSAAGRAAVERRETLDRQMEALGPRDLSTAPSPPDWREKADELLSLLKQSEEYTPAEKAFRGTVAGAALAAHADQSQADIQAALQDLWPQAAAEAELRYCSSSKCGDDETIFFRHLSYVFKPANFTRQPAFHTMGGLFADDLFARAADVGLAKAACAGDAKSVAASVAAGADPNAIGKVATGPDGSLEGVTPLLWAIDCNSMPGIDALVSAGANPNAHGAFGQTPVTIAASLPNPTALELLLKRGGDPNAEDDQQSALRNEQEFGQSQAGWDALLAAGADINHGGLGDSTVADWAVMGRDFDRVIDLLDRGYNHNLTELAHELSADADCPIDPTQHASWVRLVAMMKSRGFTIEPRSGCADAVQP